MESGTASAGNPLPVRDPVTNFEKIKRIGEGTYGVVCESSIAALTSAQPGHATLTLDCSNFNDR